MKTSEYRENVGQSVQEKIHSVVRNYCGPKIVDRYLLEQERVRSFELQLLHLNRRDVRANGEFPQAGDGRTSLDNLLTLSRQHLAGFEYQEMLLQIGSLLKNDGRLDWAEQVYGMIVSYAERTDCSDTVAEALLRRGELYSLQGRWAHAQSDLEDCRVRFEKSQNLLGLARAENILGTNFAEQGDVETATLWFIRALSRLESTREKEMTGTVLMNLGIIQNILGRWDEALNYYRRALPYFEHVGGMNRLAELAHNTGMALTRKKSYTEAIREFDRSICFSTKLGSAGLIGASELGKANAYVEQGDCALALAFCNLALEHFDRVNSRLAIADGYKIKAVILCRMKQFQLAETYFQSSIRINEEQNSTLNLGETWFEIGMMYKELRQLKPAREAFARARSAFRKVGAESEVQRTDSEMTLLGKSK
jgi:tetratricopeptide (TPR) repeat protein